MTTLRQFTCDDLFRFNPVNLDPLTETYGVQFYLQYLARWPEYFLVAESPSNDIMGKNQIYLKSCTIHKENIELLQICKQFITYISTVLTAFLRHLLCTYSCLLD